MKNGYKENFQMRLEYILKYVLIPDFIKRYFDSFLIV